MARWTWRTGRSDRPRTYSETSDEYERSEEDPRARAAALAAAVRDILASRSEDSRDPSRGALEPGARQEEEDDDPPLSRRPRVNLEPCAACLGDLHGDHPFPVAIWRGTTGDPHTPSKVTPQAHGKPLQHVAQFSTAQTGSIKPSPAREIDLAVPGASPAKRFAQKFCAPFGAELPLPARSRPFQAAALRQQILRRPPCATTCGRAVLVTQVSEAVQPGGAATSR